LDIVLINRLFKRIIKVGLLTTAFGCVSQPPSVDFGISESNDFSVRRQHFEAMSNRQLCQIALDLERTGLGQRYSFTHAPFWFNDDRLRPAADSRFINGTELSEPRNEDISMAELQRRYMAMRITVCPILESMTGLEALAIDRNCVEVANAIEPEQLCTGQYDGKPFSVALLDAHAVASQRSAREREASLRTQPRSGGISCTTSRGLGNTIHTRCY
jgi:hypothetical protein